MGTKVLPRDADTVLQWVNENMAWDSMFPQTVNVRTVKLHVSYFYGQTRYRDKYIYAIGKTDVMDLLRKYASEFLQPGAPQFFSTLWVRRGSKWYRYLRMSVPENAEDFVIVRTWSH